MMTLITGFTCPPTIYFKFITKCDKCYYKVRQLFLLQSAMVCYYKVRQLFYYKVRQVLLQSATGVTKCDNFITKCDRYYKVRRLLQSATVHRIFSTTNVYICSENASHIGGFYFMRLATSERRVPDFIVLFMFTSVGECKVNEPTTVRYELKF